MGYMLAFGTRIIDIDGDASGTKFRQGRMPVSNQDVHDLSEAGYIRELAGTKTTYAATPKGLAAAQVPFDGSKPKPKARKKTKTKAKKKARKG